MPKTKKKIFISQPVYEQQSLEDFYGVRMSILTALGEDDYEAVYNYLYPDIRSAAFYCSGEHNTKYGELAWIGVTIKQLEEEEVDLVVFAPGWRDYRECLALFDICNLYDVPYIDFANEFL